MAVDWRALLSSIGVQWKDKGNNCSRGHVNINCPFCHDDPSFHAGINEETGHYSCWRNTNHWGSDPARLLQKLTRSRTQALALLEKYETGIPITKREPVEKPRNGEWDKFLPASENDACMDYLWNRGFDDPERVANQAGLKYARHGVYQHRLLMPLYDHEMVARAWTGRALRDDVAMRYKTEAHPDSALLIYTDAVLCGLAKAAGNMSVIVVEGPMDALKINSYKEDRDILAIGLTGLKAPEGRFYTLSKIKPKRIFLCLDDNSPLAIRAKLRKIADRDAPALSVKVPDGFHDPGEMPQNKVNPWIKGFLREARIS